MSSTCTICQSESFRIIYDLNEAGQIVECRECAHYFTSLPDAINAQSLYNDDDEVYKVIENRDSIFDKILNMEYSAILSRINNYFKASKEKLTLLDFGCGKGKFPWLAKQAGWEATGVETSPPRAKYCREVYGVEVKTDFYNGGKISEQPYDVISLFHVLEHLPHPITLLHELVSHNLKKEGILVIEIPNFNSLQSGIGRSNWLHLDVPRHLNHYTEKKLDESFRSIHLSTLKKEHFSFHLGVLGMLQSIFTLFGYKGKIIYSLKNNFTFGLFLAIILVLPFAFILEFFAALVNKGGVIRYYLRKE